MLETLWLLLVSVGEAAPVPQCSGPGTISDPPGLKVGVGLSLECLGFSDLAGSLWGYQDVLVASYRRSHLKIPEAGNHGVKGTFWVPRSQSPRVDLGWPVLVSGGPSLHFLPLHLFLLLVTYWLL